MKILVVEDDLNCSLLLQELLKNYGQILTAQNGLEALEHIKTACSDNTPFDLICLDIMMPEMDGQEALREIRKIEQDNGIFSTEGAKIVMITALRDITNISSAFSGLCDDYITKPIDKSSLLATLKKLDLLD